MVFKGSSIPLLKGGFSGEYNNNSGEITLVGSVDGVIYRMTVAGGKVVEACIADGEGAWVCNGQIYGAKNDILFKIKEVE